MNRSIYKKIAKENGISIREVKEEMELAIKAAYENPNEVALKVPRKGAVPTPEEFIDYCAREAKPLTPKVQVQTLENF